MALPNVLLSAPVIWRPPSPLGPPAPTCSLMCYQPVSQCQTYWCWAAVLQELLRCVAHQVQTQCFLVETHLHIACRCRASGCDPSILSPCNRTGVLQDYLGSVSQSLVQMQAGLLDRDLLCRALNADRPVVALFIHGNQRHYAVLSGLTITTDGKAFLEVIDPWQGRRLCQIPLIDHQAVKHPDGWFLNRVFFI